MPPADANRQKLTFPKRERVCSKQAFQQLIHANQHHFRFPLKCYYIVYPSNEERSHSAIAIAVPKRVHKHAVARNRIKRLIRESWRRNHQAALIGFNVCFDLLFVYVSKDILPYSEMEKCMKELLRWLSKQTKRS
ncbi:MAG: ribonuclease P protein component [Bacteroidales bacterium]|nr:ribonuclease P protein component [Bacteroidales bacterium]